jgi:hypothetical protein
MTVLLPQLFATGAETSPRGEVFVKSKTDMPRSTERSKRGSKTREKPKSVRRLRFSKACSSIGLVTGNSQV